MKSVHGGMRTVRSRLVVLMLILFTGFGTACDSLLDVTLPGDVEADDINDPALARSITVAAIGEYECALGAYLTGTGLLSDEYLSSSARRTYNVWGARLLDLNRWLGGCMSALSGDELGFYVALSRARFQLDDAYTRIEAFPAEELSHPKDETLAMLAAFAGYSYVLLGEAFCEMAIDGGPLMTRAQVMEVAVQRFTSAEEIARQAGLDDVRYLALVGRARAHLNLGHMTEAAADARLIPEGFIYNATYSTVSTRRQNRQYINTHRNEYLSVAPSYRNLEVDGVADPRVPVLDTGHNGDDESTPLFLQMKYTTPSSPIPIARWEEAQLIIAEAELGQSAVDRINALRDHHGLPTYTPANVADANEILAQVLEERRRELFSEGHRLNDMLRHDVPFPTGLNHKGEPYGPITCMPLPEQEKDANPNI